jgi:hypothetical protein
MGLLDEAKVDVNEHPTPTLKKNAVQVKGLDETVTKK